MAKSAWKFSQTNLSQIYSYIVEFKLPTKKQNLQKVGLAPNSYILNSLNYMHNYVFFLGNCYTKKKFSKFSIRSKGMEFLKFKKPFNFKPKKKKK